MSEHLPVKTQWLVDDHIDTPRAYSITVGDGLHISAAIATMRTDGGAMGRLEFDGIGLSCMRVDGGHDFRTELRPGISRTIGMHLSTSDEALDDPTIASIWKAMGQGRQARATFRAPPALIARLCRPIDPWFGGHARALALEARQLELQAMVMAWLGGEHGRSLHRHHDFARKARELIEDDPGSDMSIATLARRVGLNARSLTEAFRASYEVSIADYVLRCRLDRALDLLMTGRTVAEVAHHVGYTPAHFSVVFRNRFGIPPGKACATPDLD